MLAPNGQGLLQGWNSLLARPGSLLIKDIKVQVNKQKPSNVCPAQMKHNSGKRTIAPMSCQPCSKPNVSGCFYLSSPSCFRELKLKLYCSSTGTGFLETLFMSFPSFVHKNG